MLAALNLSLFAGGMAEGQQDSPTARTPDSQATPQERWAQSRPGNIRVVTREVSLGEVPSMAHLNYLVTSADNRHIWLTRSCALAGGPCR
jgi:hypothetical protein